MAYCSNCGSKIPDGAKFCEGCGTRVVAEEVVNNATTRVVMYDGVIKKCPNCGKPLGSNELFCESCGWEKRNAEVSTVTLFKKIEAIESNFELDSEEKIKMITSIVRSFSIPNNLEDLYNFLDEAKINKDLKHYGDYVSESEKELAQAWEIKYEQAYRKADRLAGNRADFKRYAEEKAQEENPYYVVVDNTKQPVDPKTFKKSKTAKTLIAFIIISAILAISAFASSSIVSGVMGILMTVSLVIAYLMFGSKIKAPKKVLCYIPIGITVVLFIVYVIMMA